MLINGKLDIFKKSKDLFQNMPATKNWYFCKIGAGISTQMENEPLLTMKNFLSGPKDLNTIVPP